MKSLQFFSILLLSLATILFVNTSCKKKKVENWETMKKLYKTYKNGEISQCKYNDETVFTAQLNAYDAETVVFDKNGKKIGSCNYGWGSVDPICNELKSCEAIYRVDKNIWGLPAVDKYDLKK
ncbi:hypothetical protein D3C87_21230 [compost metagenome]